MVNLAPHVGQRRPKGLRSLLVMIGGGFLFALPLIVIVYQAVTVLGENIQAARIERYSLTYHDRLIYLLERLQEVRGLTFGVQSGDGVLKDRLQLAKDEAARALLAVDDADRFYGEKLSTHVGWQKTRQEIQALSTGQDAIAPVERFKRYSNTIHSLTNFMVDVADAPNLSAGLQLSSDYLAQATIHGAPEIMEDLARMRGLTTGLIASGKPSSQWPEEQVDEVQALLNELAVHDQDMQIALERAKRVDPDAEQFIGYHQQVIDPALRMLRHHIAPLLSGHMNDMSASDMFQMVTDTIATYDLLYHKTSNSFLALLDRRQKEYAIKRDLVLGASIAAFIGFGAIFLFLYRNLMRKERMEAEIMAANWRLREEGARTAAIVDHVSDAIITIDSHGIIRNFNKAAELSFGYASGEVIGHNIMMLMPEVYREAHATSLKRYLNTGEKHVIGIGAELPGLRKDGSQFPMALSINEVTVGDEILFVGVARNIAQQKEKEEYLRLAKEQAEASNNVKSDFLANMSHELRTPLNSILGMTRLLINSSLGEHERQLAGVVFRSSVHLLEIVNDILDLSKIEAGEMNLEHIGMDLAYLLHGSVHALEYIAKEKRLNLALHCDVDTFPYVLGDPTRFMRVLNNLISNAIKYTDKGSVDVFAFCKKIGSAHVEFYCEVKDTGIGIPKNKIEKVFDKFVQADLSTTRKYGGTGLGLTITDQLVRLMGGAISVESEEGIGSTFSFAIPFETTDKLHQDKQMRRRKMLEGTILPQKARILVAEDHPMNQELIIRLLEYFGIGTFEVVGTGTDVLKRHGEESWDIILMDCHMPEKNGYDTTTAIREVEKGTGRRIPIVAMTANAMVGDKEKCLRYGMDEYIRKPVSFEELKEVLGQWVRFDDLTITGGDGESNSHADPSLDLSLMRDFARGDHERERKFARLFVEESDKNIQDMTGYFENNNVAMWSEAAHTLKGGAAGMGANRLADMCEEAQHFKGEAEALIELHEEICVEYKQVKAKLEQSGLLSP